MPASFCRSYTVPLIQNNYSALRKTLTVDDFRRISISSVISKIFEHCILDRFGDFLSQLIIDSVSKKIEDALMQYILQDVLFNIIYQTDQLCTRSFESIR